MTNSMKGQEEMLNSIRRTVQMGESGILSTIRFAKSEPFRMALQQQAAEYHQISNSADALLQKTGCREKNVPNMVKTCSASWAKMQLRRDGTDSKLAEMMITGNTKGIIKGLRQLHRHGGCNASIDALSEKLLATEHDNIAQMKQYL